MGHSQSKPTLNSCTSFITAESCKSDKKIVDKIVTESSCNSFISSNSCSKYFPSITAENCSKFIPKCPAPQPCPTPLPCPTFCPSPVPCPPPVSCSKITSESSQTQTQKTQVIISDTTSNATSIVTPNTVSDVISNITSNVTPNTTSSVTSNMISNVTSTKSDITSNKTQKIIDISDIKNVLISPDKKLATVSISDMNNRNTISSNTTKIENKIPYVVFTQYNSNPSQNLTDRKCLSVDNNLKININKCNMDQPNTITWLTKPLNDNDSNLIHVASGKCLDIKNNKINLNNCDEKNIYQKWQILENHNSVTIKQADISKCIEIDSSSNIVMNNCTGNNNQSWISVK